MSLYFSDPQLDPDLRSKLIEARMHMPDRQARVEALQQVLRVWLVTRHESTMGAYWPINGEFDPLPALYRWSEAQSDRKIGLPVVHRREGTLRFHVWYPGCPMEHDAFDIPKPKDTEVFAPEVLLIPCLAYGPAGVRLGYGGGFYERTAGRLEPKPLVVGLAFSNAFLPLLRPNPQTSPLDVLLTDDGLVWERGEED